MGSPLPLPRALLIFAHSDDEVIAVGGRMERYRESIFVCVTDGVLPGSGASRGYASDDEYRRARREERLTAFRLAGLRSRQAHPDGLEALEGRIVDQQACNHLVPLTRKIAAAIEGFRPETVITHPYEGGHPDHDSCAFAVHAARRLLAPARRLPIVEAPFYQYLKGSFTWGSFLHEADWPSCLQQLGAEEQTKKKARLDCFRSQGSILMYVPLTDERYRIAPAYDFAKPPHPAFSNYAHVGCPLSGADFLLLASEALRELGLA